MGLRVQGTGGICEEVSLLFNLFLECFCFSTYIGDAFCDISHSVVTVTCKPIKF